MGQNYNTIFGENYFIAPNAASIMSCLEMAETEYNELDSLLGESTSLSESSQIITESVFSKIKSAWKSFTKWVKETWEKIVGWFKDKFGQIKSFFIKNAAKKATVAKGIDGKGNTTTVKDAIMGLSKDNVESSKSYKVKIYPSVLKNEGGITKICNEDYFRLEAGLDGLQNKAKISFDNIDKAYKGTNISASDYANNPESTPTGYLKDFNDAVENMEDSFKQFKKSSDDVFAKEDTEISSSNVTEMVNYYKRCIDEFSGLNKFSTTMQKAHKYVLATSKEVDEKVNNFEKAAASAGNKGNFITQAYGNIIKKENILIKGITIITSNLCKEVDSFYVNFKVVNNALANLAGVTKVFG